MTTLGASFSSPSVCTLCEETNNLQGTEQDKFQCLELYQICLYVVPIDMWGTGETILAAIVDTLKVLHFKT